MNEEKNELQPREEGEAVVKTGRIVKREQGEKRSRRWVFFLIDLLLLAAIVAAILFVVSLLTPFNFSRRDSTEKRTVTYTVEIARVNADSVEALHVGDTVTDGETGAVLGTVSAVDVGLCEEYRTDLPATQQDEALGSYVVPKITYPDNYKTVVLTITVTAEYEAGVGYRADGCRIAVEKVYDLRLPGFEGQGVCVSLSE